MKGVVISKPFTTQVNRSNFKDFLKSIITPFIFGIYGFSLLLLFLIFAKFISYLIGNNPSFSFDLEFISISIVGFVLFFLIKLIEILRGLKL